MPLLKFQPLYIYIFIFIYGVNILSLMSSTVNEKVLCKSAVALHNIKLRFCLYILVDENYARLKIKSFHTSEIGRILFELSNSVLRTDCSFIVYTACWHTDLPLSKYDENSANCRMHLTSVWFIFILNFSLNIYIYIYIYIYILY